MANNGQHSRGPTTPIDVVVEIHTLAAAGANAAQIERHLSAVPEFADRLPGLRTIQKFARQVKVGERTWSAMKAHPVEAHLVMPVLGELARRGIVTSLAPAMAQWIASVRRIRPEIDLYDAFRFAVRYQSATPAQMQEIDVDLAQHPRPPIDRDFAERIARLYDVPLNLVIGEDE